MDILKFIVSILTILGLFKLCFQWPVNVNRKFSSNYGQQGWSLTVSIILAVLIFAIVLERNNLFRFLFNHFSCCLLLCIRKNHCKL